MTGLTPESNYSMNLLNQTGIVKTPVNNSVICLEDPGPRKNQFERKKYYSLDPEFTTQDSFLINLNIQHKFTRSLNRLLKIGCFNYQDILNFDRLTKALNNCGNDFLIGKCQNNHDHNFVITQRCRKESCKVCGSDDSAAHISRKRKTATGLIGYKNLAYLVFTIPEDLRGKFLNPDVMKKFTRKVKKILFKLGIVCTKKEKYIDKDGKTKYKTVSAGSFKGGLLRWHFLGEDHKEKQESNVFHPHLNVILGTDQPAWMQKELLQKLKMEVSQYLYHLGSINLKKQAKVFYTDIKTRKQHYRTIDWITTSITHLSWRKDIKSKWHLFRYVTRSTLTYQVLENEITRLMFLDDKELNFAKKFLITKGDTNNQENPLMFWKLAKDLIGFRNNNFFGKVRKNDFNIKDFVEKDDTRTELEKNTLYEKINTDGKKCPVCSGSLEWGLHSEEHTLFDFNYKDEGGIDIAIDESKKILKFDEFVQNPLKTLKLLDGIKDFL